MFLAPRVNARGAASGAEVFFWRWGGALLGVPTWLFRREGAHPCTRVSEGGGDALLVRGLVLPINLLLVAGCGRQKSVCRR